MSQPTPPPLIHIGLHKTATTSLQHLLFGPHEALCALGLPNSRPDRDLRALRDGLFSLSDAEWAEGLEAAQALVSAKAGTLQPVFSEENLSTGELRDPPIVKPPLGEATDYPYVAGGQTVTRRQLATRLAELFPGAQVLIVLREQSAYLTSYFLQLQKTGRLNGRFGAWLTGQEGLPQDQSFLPMLDYDAGITIWEEVLGPRNVHVVCYETLRQDPAAFAAALAPLMAAPEADILTALTTKQQNPRVSKLDILLRPLRRVPVLGAALRPVARLIRPYLPAQSEALTDAQRGRLVQAVAASNARLAARRNLPLAELGYTCR